MIAENIIIMSLMLIYLDMQLKFSCTGLFYIHTSVPCISMNKQMLELELLKKLKF